MNIKGRILIVDDEPDVARFLTYNFTRQGYETDAAENGLEGIHKADSFLPDLIIADIMMPGMNGITMCRVLKNKNQHRNIPLIFLSAVQDDHQAIGAGMEGDEYVSKPVKFSVLLSIVQKYLPLDLSENG